jgi:excisionase family DNA binding protein
MTQSRTPLPLSLDEIAEDPSRGAQLPLQVRQMLIVRCASVMASLAALGCDEPDLEKESPTTSNPEPLERLLAVPEAAGLMGFATSYVYEIIRRGDLPAVKRGKYVRIRASSLAEWIRRHEDDGTGGQR